MAQIREEKYDPLISRGLLLRNRKDATSGPEVLYIDQNICQES